MGVWVWVCTCVWWKFGASYPSTWPPHPPHTHLTPTHPNNINNNHNHHLLSKTGTIDSNPHPPATHTHQPPQSPPSLHETGTIDPAAYAEANAFFLKAGLLSKPLKTEHSLDPSVWK
jgi:hypothetical protein